MHLLKLQRCFILINRFFTFQFFFFLLRNKKCNCNRRGKNVERQLDIFLGLLPVSKEERGKKKKPNRSQSNLQSSWIIEKKISDGQIVMRSRSGSYYNFVWYTFFSVGVECNNTMMPVSALWLIFFISLLSIWIFWTQSKSWVEKNVLLVCIKWAI